MYSNIIWEKKDGVGYITLNRPNVLNAISLELLREIEQVLQESATDDGVQAVVITGTGRAFSAGADMKVFSEVIKAPLRVKHWLDTWHGIMNYIETQPKPTIARVNGLALAGGLELMLVCDLAVADEEARLGDQHAVFGVIAGGGGSQRLPRLLGARRAKELLYTGSWISGKEAERIGLVNRAVPASQLDAAVKELTDRLKERSSVATSTVKSLVNFGLQADLLTGLEMEKWATMTHNQTDDAQEGFRAFMEKRKPKFTGR